MDATEELRAVRGELAALRDQFARIPDRDDMANADHVLDNWEAWA